MKSKPKGRKFRNLVAYRDSIYYDRAARSGSRPADAGAFQVRIDCSDASPAVSAEVQGRSVSDGDVIQAAADGARPGLLRVVCTDGTGQRDVDEGETADPTRRRPANRWRGSGMRRRFSGPRSWSRRCTRRG